MKKTLARIGIVAAALALPAVSWAAGGGGATELVVVADTRVTEGVLRYFADLYNFNITLFAVWCVVLTAGYGCILGFGMDWLISKTGLDLKSRKIVEH